MQDFSTGVWILRFPLELPSRTGFGDHWHQCDVDGAGGAVGRRNGDGKELRP